METDVIGFIAGSLVAGSAMPKLISRISKATRREAAFDGAELTRDAAQALGNLLWIYVGLRSGLVSITLFCAVSVVLLAALVILNLRERGMRSREANAR